MLPFHRLDQKPFVTVHEFKRVKATDINTIETYKTICKKGTVSPKDAVYAIPLGGTGWVVKSSEAKKFTAITNSMREAVTIAQLLAKRNGRIVIVFGKNGSIRRRFG